LTKNAIFAILTQIEKIEKTEVTIFFLYVPSIFEKKIFSFSKISRNSEKNSDNFLYWKPDILGFQNGLIKEIID
jgi:hypothetical protein